MCRFCIEQSLYHKKVIEGIVDQRPMRTKSKKKNLDWLVVHLGSNSRNTLLEFLDGNAERVKVYPMSFRIFGEYRDEQTAMKVLEAKRYGFRLYDEHRYFVVCREMYNRVYKHLIV